MGYDDGYLSDCATPGFPVGSMASVPLTITFDVFDKTHSIARS